MLPEFLDLLGRLSSEGTNPAPHSRVGVRLWRNGINRSYLDLKLSLDDGKCAGFFAQDPRIREKRVQLESRLERLKKAQALISASV